MINVEQITSRLAKMPDQALQQYAAMHKDDPYIMALAVSESNRRKQLRQAAQAPQGEQPKVADQALAEMAPEVEEAAAVAGLPEESGIAQLPAGNMDFAGGGIVAFADGGGVERYQVGGMPPLTEGTPYAIPGMTVPTQSWLPPRRADEQPGEDTIRRAIEAANAQSLRFSGRPLTEGEAQRIRAQFGENFEQASRMAPTPAASTPARTAAAAPPAAASVPAPATAGGQPPAAPSTSDRAPVGPAMPSLDVAKMTETALAAAEKRPNPFAVDFEKLGQERVRAKEEEVKGLEAIQKQFSDIYKGRKERLDTREGELSKMKDQQTGLALLQAGAAIMSTPGGLGTALGKGVQVGSEKYAAGLEKLQAAKDKITDARDRLEEIEAQRGELSARELNKARNEVTNAGLSAREDLIKANMQMYGVNRETAMKIVEGQIRVGVAQMEGASRERVAGIQARAVEGKENQRLAQLAQTVRKNAMDAALKAYPYNEAKRNEFVQQEIQKAVQYNPDLAQYVSGAAGGGSAPAPGAATHRFNPATGQVEPVR